MNRRLPYPVWPNPDPKVDWTRAFLLSMTSWAQRITELCNSSVQGLGADLVAGPELVLTSAMHKVSGTDEIIEIVPQPGHTGPVWLLAQDVWTIGTSGNVMSAVTATAGRAYELIYDGERWYPVTVS